MTTVELIRNAIHDAEIKYKNQIKAFEENFRIAGEWKKAAEETSVLISEYKSDIETIILRHKEEK